ncbi:hypothetical protein N9850_08090 [Granulosicoccus sp.]|nr:hypothetical protein [Granulosicoccus sp.]MDB4223721.1 hypothetical protein [Granulosicoccus sp.]
MIFNLFIVSVLLPEFDQNDCRLEERWSYLARTEDVIENHQLLALITNSLEQLPGTYRIVLHLRDIEGERANPNESRIRKDSHLHAK